MTQINWFGLRVNSRLALSHINQKNRVNSQNGFVIIIVLLLLCSVFLFLIVTADRAILPTHVWRGPDEVFCTRRISATFKIETQKCAIDTWLIFAAVRCCTWPQFFCQWIAYWAARRAGGWVVGSPIPKHQHAAVELFGSQTGNDLAFLCTCLDLQ